MLSFVCLACLVLFSGGQKEKRTLSLSPQALRTQLEMNYEADYGAIMKRPVTAVERLRAEQPAEIERLIQELKSPNQDPNSQRPDGPDYTDGYPTNYDFKAQLRVHEAERLLIALGKHAYPYLIDHSEDKPYSTSDWYSSLLSFSVGDVCFRMIEHQINVAGKRYKANRQGTDGEYKSYPDYFESQLWLPGDSPEMSRKERLERWWNRQKDRPLREIQIEALEYAIKNEEAIGFPNGDSDRRSYLDHFVKALQKVKAQ